jgi:hypothetical protein
MYGCPCAVTAHEPVGRYQCFEGTHYLHLQKQSHVERWRVYIELGEGLGYGALANQSQQMG